MDVPKNCVAKWTRHQRQKVEEELLEKAKKLKEEKDKRKRSVNNSSSKAPIPKITSNGRSSKAIFSSIDLNQYRKQHQDIATEQISVSGSGQHEVKSPKEKAIFLKDKRPKTSSKDGSSEASNSDIEILENVLPGQNRELYQDIAIDQSSVSRTGYKEKLLEKEKGFKDNKKKRSLKRGSKDSHCGASSSSSDFEIRENIFPGQNRELYQDISVDQKTPLKDGNKNQRIQKDIGAPSRSNSVSSSEDDDDLTYYKGDGSFKVDENQNQGRQGEICNFSDFNWGSSSEQEDNGESEGDGNQNQGRNVENGDTVLSVSESSSEEEDDGKSDDSDYKGVESDETVKSVSDSDVLCYHNEYNLEKLNPIEERENKRRKVENVREESGKKNEVLDLGTWFDKIDRDEELRKSRLERLRPRQFPESRKNNKLEFGRPSRPIRIVESDGSNESDDDHASDSDSDHIVEKSSKKIKVAGKRGRRKNCGSKDVDFMNILSDSIWDKCDGLKEKLSPLKEKDPEKNAIPLKFKFEDEEDPAPPEKDGAHKEVDNLFADLEMGWTEDDIGDPKLSKEDENYDAAKVTDPAESCKLGYHHLILNEQIGVICNYCGIVQQEMKHILPDLKIPTWRKQEQFDPYNDKFSTSYGFEFGDSTYGDHHIFTDTEGSVLDLIPAALRRQMYPHQLDGFQFLWKNIAGATLIKDIKTPFPEEGTGCIISHAPGTGKTYLTIVFLLTFMKVHPNFHPVIIAPLTMLRAWAEELKRWKINIPFHNLNDPELSGEENTVAASFIQRARSSKKDPKRDRDYKRMVKLYSWTKDRSILAIGYSLFEKLAGEHRNGDHAEKFREILLELPSILILDEGHTPRNQNSLLWKALTKVKTGRRIILSGTPFQNNFDELYNTFCLVNPRFSEHLPVEMCKRRAPRRTANLARGRWASFTNLIDKNADDALEELRAMMDPFVHVHKGTILQESLPGLRDTLVVLNPTALQKKLLEKIPENVLEKVHLVSLVSVHPSLVSYHESFSDHKSKLEELETSPEAGAKTQFVIEIVRLSKARDEKVLVFSEYIDPLNFLMKQLISYFSWEEGKQVLYMDGKLDEKQRQLVIHSLNAENSEAKVLLASTKACCEGINLVGASRVVLLDVVWNPSVERQAISRAYRLGQKKFVYVYHLIMSGTMELEKYQRQAKKDRISELVFSCPDGQNYKPETLSVVADDKILEAMVTHKKLLHIFEKILHQPKESNVFENFNFVSTGK